MILFSIISQVALGSCQYPSHVAHIAPLEALMDEMKGGPMRKNAHQVSRRHVAVHVNLHLIVRAATDALCSVCFNRFGLQMCC